MQRFPLRPKICFFSVLPLLRKEGEGPLFIRFLYKIATGLIFKEYCLGFIFSLNVSSEILKKYLFRGFF